MIKNIDMNKIIVGLFQNQEKATALSQKLENAGIQNSKYIVYLNEKEAQETKPTFWERIIGTSNTEIVNLNTEKLIISVELLNEIDEQAVLNIFSEYEVVNTYEFENMTIEEAKDLNYIKKIVEIKTKAQIFNVPEFKKHSASDTMNAEVKA